MALQATARLCLQLAERLSGWAAAMQPTPSPLLLRAVGRLILAAAELFDALPQWESLTADDHLARGTRVTKALSTAHDVVSTFLVRHPDVVDLKRLERASKGLAQVLGLAPRREGGDA